MNKPKKIKLRSLANRINFALISRKFLKNIIIDLITVILIVCAWCGIVERSSCPHERISNRMFTGSVFTIDELETNLAPITAEIKNDGVFTREDFEAVKSYLPFSGVSYSFTSTNLDTGDITMHEENAGVILTLVCIIFVILFVLQLLEFLWGFMSGSRVIRRYLRPINDLAVMAEQLSSEEVSQAVPTHMDNGHDDTDISTKELSSLSYAIDSIDDSSRRIEIHDTELSGIEAAVNNMLRRLEEGKRKQIRFVDDASHELRTPIAVIQGYANMLDRWGKDDPEVRDEAIAAIKTESEHMKTLIDQLLFLARGEMDRHLLDIKPLNACEIMQEIYDESILLEAEAEDDKRHEFATSELYDESGECLREEIINADAAMIKQAVRILRDNAMRYTPAHGKITLRAYGRGDEVCMEVVDSGMGIDSEELPRIFDRFYRGTNARADNTGGSGLGLSIAKWIAESHGGRIEALSGIGFGTKMTIVLKKMKNEE